MKIFKKERFNNGRRHIYFLGIKVFSYQRHQHIKTYRNFNYKTYNDLAFDIKSQLVKIPKDIDLVVGIPRSGMIPAYIIGLALNKPVCSVPEFINGMFGGHGITRKIHNTKKIKKVLIVDDTINSGNSMIKVKEQLKDIQNKYDCKFMAVYSSCEEVSKKIDIALHVLPQPRFFQWNYMFHVRNIQSCFDMDGVLCFDPTPEQNDDGKNYIDFIKNARPLYLPAQPIGYIVTSRLEKYRKETEEWLKKHNVNYKKLYMFNGTAEERRRLGLHAVFKAKIYKELKDTDLFIESEPGQAQQIADLTGKVVMCCADDKMYLKSK